MALSSQTVWEIRSAGSNNNGGGYVTGSSGTDYSQQNSAQYALTSVTTAGADAILLHASAAADMVGNICQIISGTNFTAGFYEIVSVVAGVSITLDRTCTSGAGTSGVVNIGGALASIGKIGSATIGLGAVAGNVIWVKADGTYSVGASDTFSIVGTGSAPVIIEGYNSTRGDGYLGRNTTGNGKLITTNMPNYQYQATFRLIGSSSSFVIVKTINFSCAGAGTSNPVVQIGTDSIIFRCAVTNPSTNTAASGITCASARGTIFDCDIFMTGTSGGATGAGIVISALGSRSIANRVEMSQSSSAGPGISAASASAVLRNTIIGSGGTAGIFISTTSGYPLIDSNTIVGFVDGINVITANNLLQFFTNNLITDCTTYAINNTDAGMATFNAYNRLRDPITVNQGTAWTQASSFGNVTTDGAAYSDYVNQAGGDYRLISTSPAASSALPAASSMGALQRTQNQETSGLTPYRAQRNLPDIRIK